MIATLLLIAAVESVPAPQCLTQSQAVEAAAEIGGKVVGSAHYTGSVTTDMLILQMPGAIVLLGFNAAGCYVGQKIIEPAIPGPGA